MTEHPILISFKDRMRLDDYVGPALGQDPTNGPAIYYFNRKAEGALYPCVVLRPPPGGFKFDERFHESGQYIGRQFLDMEIWTQSRASGAVSDLHALIVPLFHNQVLSLPDSGPTGRRQGVICYRVELFGETKEPFFDPGLKAWAGFYRYLIYTRSFFN